MKSTPNVPANAPVNVPANDKKEAVIVKLSDVLQKTKEQTPEAIKEPTSYPTPAPTENQPAENPTPQESQPQAEAPAPAQTMALVPVRSRQEEIDFQVEKSRQLQLINTQLVSLKDKLAELKQFCYTVDKNDDSRYGRLSIFDDYNREFVCKNHGVSALVVDCLKKVFSEKIEEKETELLTVSKS
jgi:hypothetical protein